MSIQGAINSMIGSAARGAAVVKGIKAISPQAQAEKVATKSATNAVQAKTKQRRRFLDYIQNQETSIGKVKDLPLKIQQAVANSYSKSERQQLMNKMDKEAKRK